MWRPALLSLSLLLGAGVAQAQAPQAAVEKVALENVDMKKVLAPYGDAEESLTLMTCTGKWLKDEATYDHRAIVYAVAVT